MRITRTSAACLAAGALTLTLTACGPQAAERDAETGEITEASEADVFSIAVGDCINSAELGTEVETVPTVPCDEPHDTEIYGSTFLPDGEYPGDDAIVELANEYCLPEFASFIGLDYDSSEIYYQPLTPSQMSWDEADDREVLCLAVDEAGGLTGTLEGANR
jgi:hypothetical protein